MASKNAPKALNTVARSYPGGFDEFGEEIPLA